MHLPDILRQARIVAIIGCSQNVYRASNHAARDLVEAGYSVIPVNPKYDTVNGLRCYDDLAEIPDDIAIDIVNVFRNPAHSLEAVKTVVTRAARTGSKPTIWMQPGVSTADSEAAATSAGLAYVRDKCIMVELAMGTTDRQ